MTNNNTEILSYDIYNASYITHNETKGLSS